MLFNYDTRGFLPVDVTLCCVTQCDDVIHTVSGREEGWGEEVARGVGGVAGGGRKRGGGGGSLSHGRSRL